MPSSFMVDLLRRWQQGKKLSKHQYAELVNDGLLLIAGPGDTYALTDKAHTILKPN